MANEHNKYEYNTMIFALPIGAPRFTKKQKKTQKNQSKHRSKMLSSWGPEASKTRLRKTTPKRTHENRKNVET